MAEDRPEGSSPVPLNLNSVLAVVTLVGGLWLVSHRLTSNRPMASGGVIPAFIGDQTLSARLWEDPFKSSDSDAAKDSEAGLGILLDQIRSRAQSNNRVLLLPVMLAGGQYSEDVESRVRSRYAVVSALGVSGFAPEDAEHLGAITLRWPSRHDVVTAIQGPSPAKDKPSALRTSSRMDLRYEWYRARTFFPPTNCPASSVLVLWLDDSFFEDAPLFRLPLLLEPLLANASNVALIGPRRSSTLRAMLPNYTPGIQSLTTSKNSLLPEHSKEILGRIDLYCATPSAMDEALVLVTNQNCLPRETVQTVIKNAGFKSFHNYVATDAQLAGEVLDELDVDGIGLNDPDNHLVLISEWDTFYGRMLSLTYQAELASRQHRRTSRSDFVQAVMTNDVSRMPSNFHSFVYLRGLDGQTVKSTEDTGNGADQGAGRDKKLPGSFEEIRNWTPDANMAQGQAQFDYLSRLGNQLQELQRDLKRSGRGELKAVGVVGSDVYDTLLILQALHSQSLGLDRVVFFTTDMDARFLHPRENEWTRDLLVVSSYGLALHPDLQCGVAPFRESAQTAQFAATLAALGNTQLAQLKFVSPRRFEIGKQINVDWSTNTPAELANTVLHPLTRNQLYHLHPDKKVLWRTVQIGLPILIFVCLLWNTLRRVTFRGIDFCCQALDYTEEDIGTPERAAFLLKKIRPGLGGGPQWVREKFQQLDQRFAEESERDGFILLAFLNYLLDEEIPLSCDKNGDWVYHQKPQEKDPSFSAKFKAWCDSAWDARTRFKLRQRIDSVIDRSSKPGAARNEPAALQEELAAAKDARRCAREIFCLRCWLIAFYWTTALLFAVLGCRLAWLAWRDTFQLPQGEPFSLTNGVSAWPGEILRFLVVVFAVWFAFGLYYRMRETYFTLTRYFRLRIHKQFKVSRPQLFRELFAIFLYHEVSTAPEGFSISALWTKHYQNGLWWRRLLRIAVPLLILSTLANHFFEPEIVRGPTLGFWDPFLIRASGLGFLAVALLTIDSAMICRRFIFSLSSGPTDYNKATRAYFSRGRENTDSECLEDWIDIQLVAELTERIGKLVYYPTILLVLLLLARNGWWDNWSWPPGYIFSFVCGLLLALASVLILQNSAKKSKQQAEETLERKAAQARSREEPPPSKASQAEKLLDQLKQLKRGAFVPFWQNPVVTAFFASSGGITALQIGIWLLGR